MKKILNSILILLLFCSNTFSQYNIKSAGKYSGSFNSNSLNSQKMDTGYNRLNADLMFKKQKRISLYSDQSTAEGEPEGYALFIMLYLLNPILSISEGKGVWGFTKEISMGFGNLGQFRTSVEYSYLDQPDNMNIFRAALKYDILLAKNIDLSKDPVETSALTIGGGYYTDFDSYGYFPEISYGLSFRDSRWLMYPSLKLRLTFIKESPVITDISVGLIFGFANPFMDLRKKKSK